MNKFLSKEKKLRKKRTFQHTGKGAQATYLMIRRARYATRPPGHLSSTQVKLNLLKPFARDVTIFQDGTRFFKSQVKHASIFHPSAFAPTPTPRV